MLLYQTILFQYSIYLVIPIASHVLLLLLYFVIQIDAPSVKILVPLHIAHLISPGPLLTYNVTLSRIVRFHP
jgi:hypothetical protein